MVFEVKLIDGKNSVSYVNSNISGGVTTALKPPLFLPYLIPSTCYLRMTSLPWELEGGGLL